MLGIFERNSWPIPDILAQRGEVTLIMEVDKSLANNVLSFARYRDEEAALRRELLEIGFPTQKLALGFCRVGIASTRDVELSQRLGLEALIDFPDPLPRFRDLPPH